VECNVATNSVRSLSRPNSGFPEFGI
jgi:hypothetical protein